MRACIRFLAARVWCSAAVAEEAEAKLNEPINEVEAKTEETLAEADALSERIEAATAVIGTAALLANLLIAVTTLYQYASMAPVGGGVCRAVYTVYAVIYRPLSISMFSLLVAVCDQEHWFEVDKKPEPMRQVLKLNHSAEKPYDDNMLFVAISAIVSSFLCVLAGAALVFLPLALVFLPVVAFMDFAFPLVTVYSPLYLLGKADSFLEVRLEVNRADPETQSVCNEGLEEKSNEVDPTSSRKVKELHDKSIDVSVPQAFILKAIAAAVICSLAVVASFAGFYTKGGWVQATKALAQAFVSFTIELSFKLDVTLRWPFSLPEFAQVLYLFSLGTLVLHKALENWCHIYHRYVKKLGKKFIKEARKQGSGGGHYKRLNQVLVGTRAVIRAVLLPYWFTDM